MYATRPARDMTGPTAWRKTCENVPCAIVKSVHPELPCLVVIDKSVTGHYWTFDMDHHVKPVVNFSDVGRVFTATNVGGSLDLSANVADPGTFAAYMASGTTMLTATVTAVMCNGYVGLERITVLHIDEKLDTFEGLQKTNDAEAEQMLIAFMEKYLLSPGDSRFEWTPFMLNNEVAVMWTVCGLCAQFHQLRANLDWSIP